MRRPNTRAYLAVIVFAALLFLGFLLAVSQGWAIVRAPSQGRLADLSSVTAERFAIDSTDLVALVLTITVAPPSTAEPTRKLAVRMKDVSGIVYRADATDAASSADSLCIVVQMTPDDGDLLAGHDFFEQPLCQPIRDGESLGVADFFTLFGAENPAPEATGVVNITYTEVNTAEIPSALLENDDSDQIGLNFWYPFDHFILEQRVQVQYELRQGEDVLADGVAQPIIDWEYETSGTRLWNIELSSQTGTLSESDAARSAFSPGTYETIRLEFWRPLLYRIAFPFFVVLMVFLIGLVPLLGHRDTLVDICAAMLFGIFGLKGILGPSGEIGQTVIDIALMGLYVLLAFAAGVFFVNKVLLALEARRRPQAEAPAVSE
jgi:hypothetical protein